MDKFQSRPQVLFTNFKENKMQKLRLLMAMASLALAGAASAQTIAFTPPVLN